MTLSAGLERGLSKAAAVGLLLAVFWLLSSVLVAPLLSKLLDTQEQIAQERELLGRLLAEARGVSSRPAQEGEAEAAFLPGGSDAERIAALQSRVETVAASAGVRLSSLQPMAEQSKEKLRFIGLRVIASGSIDRVQQFFHALEDGTPTLIIQSLDIARSARNADDNGELDLRLSIAGAVAANNGDQP